MSSEDETELPEIHSKVDNERTITGCCLRKVTKNKPASTVDVSEDTEIQNSDNESSSKIESLENEKNEEFNGVLEQTTVKDVALQFLQSSSLHGLTKMLNPSIIVKAMWSSLLIGAIAVSVWQITGLTMEFLSFPVSWEVEIKRDGFRMPAVTVCKHNWMLKSKIRTHPYFSKEISEYDGPVNDSYLTSLAVRHSRSLSYEQKKELGPNASEMVTIYMSGPNTEYKRVYSTNHYSLTGTCYSFSTPATSIVLFINLNMLMSDFIDPYITDYNMYIILKDHQDSFPLDQPNTHIKVEPGQEKEVVLSHDVTKLLNGSYEQCQNHQEEFKNRTGYLYERPMCMLDCINRFLIKNCNCSYPNLPRTWRSENIKSCYNRDLQEYDECYYDYVNAKCSCKEKCNERLYYSTRSHIVDKPRYFVKQEVCKEFNRSCDANNYTDWFDSSGGRLVIIMSRQPYKVFSQKPGYPVIRYFSDIGGTLGLYLGASVLTYFEIFQFWITSLFVKLNKLVRNQ